MHPLRNSGFISVQKSGSDSRERGFFPFGDMSCNEDAEWVRIAWLRNPLRNPVRPPFSLVISPAFVSRRDPHRSFCACCPTTHRADSSANCSSKRKSENRNPELQGTVMMDERFSCSVSRQRVTVDGKAWQLSSDAWMLRLGGARVFVFVSSQRTGEAGPVPGADGMNYVVDLHRLDLVVTDSVKALW